MKTTKRYAPNGYIYVDSQLATVLFAMGFDVTTHMNNVNAGNVFDNWCLGFTWNRADFETELDFAAWHDMLSGSPIPYKPIELAFKDQYENMVSYNRGELGTYAVFCVAMFDYDLYSGIKGYKKQVMTKLVNRQDYWDGEKYIAL